MSESEFIKQQNEEFLAAHPADDGWHLYEFSNRLQTEIEIDYLLDFLRDACVAIVRRRLTVDTVRTHDMTGEEGDSHLITTGSEWDQKKPLDITSWIGTMEIEWEGHPLHYYRLPPSGYASHQCVTKAASKSNLAFRQFHASLCRYVEQREKKDRRIHVVGGVPLPIPSVQWEDVLLPSDLGTSIRKTTEAFFSPETRGIFQKLGLPYRRGYIFTGPAGCGKTLTLRALVRSMNVSVVSLQLRADVADDDLDKAFRLAEKRAPSILILEDLDRLASARDVSMSFFLNLLDGLKIVEGILIIATSNHPDKIDPALLHRPSRFDRIWRFSLPEKEQRRALLERKGSAHFSSKALDRVADTSEGFSMAYVQEIVVNALLNAICNSEKPTDRHLLKSVRSLGIQRKTAEKVDESVLDGTNIGFVRNGPGFFPFHEHSRDDDELREDFL